MFPVQPWFLLVFLATCAPLTKPSVRSPESVQISQEQNLSPLDRYLQSRPLEKAVSEIARPFIAVLPMKDVSGFREGVWDIENEFPAHLTAELSTQDVWRVIPYGAVLQVSGSPREVWPDEEILHIAKILRADIVIEGTIIDYNMERLHVGDPLVAGYKSFRGIAEVEMTAVRGEDASLIGTMYSKQETTDREVGLDLFGKPRDQDFQYVNLDKMIFGSKDFRNTPIGVATVKALVEIVDKLSVLIRPGDIRLGSEAPEILSVYGSEIFINLGSENAVHRGYRFEVFPGPERAIEQELNTLARTAIVEVSDVVGARVARGVLIGTGDIASGDRLKFIQPED